MNLKSRLYYKVSGGKKRGKFSKLDFRNKYLKVYLKVEGAGRKKTYEIPYMEVYRKFKRKFKRITSEIKEVIKSHFRESGKKQFLRDISKEKVYYSYEKEVIVGKKIPKKLEIKEGKRYYNKNLSNDVKVHLKITEDDKREQWEISFSTNYRNHPTFILLPLNVNKFYNPEKYVKIFVSGRIDYHPVLARGEKREEIIAIEKFHPYYFNFEFFSSLFKVKHYWLIPPSKKSSGITLIGMIVYNIRKIIEDLGWSISGQFQQRRRVPYSNIELYKVYLQIEGIKAKDDKFNKKFKKKMEIIHKKIIKDKKKKFREEIKLTKRAFDKTKKVGLKIKKQKGWKYIEGKGYVPTKETLKKFYKLLE